MCTCILCLCVSQGVSFLTQTVAQKSHNWDVQQLLPNLWQTVGRGLVLRGLSRHVHARPDSQAQESRVHKPQEEGRSERGVSGLFQEDPTRCVAPERQYPGHCCHQQPLSFPRTAALVEGGRTGIGGVHFFSLFSHTFSLSLPPSLLRPCWSHRPTIFFVVTRISWCYSDNYRYLYLSVTAYLLFPLVVFSGAYGTCTWCSLTVYNQLSFTSCSLHSLVFFFSLCVTLCV